MTHWKRDADALGIDTDAAREPQPGDGPDYHADLAFWRERQRDATTALELAVTGNRKIVPLDLPVGAIQLLYDVLGHFPHDPGSWSSVARGHCSVALMDARTA